MKYLCLAIFFCAISAVRLLDVDRIADVNLASDQALHRFGSVGTLGRLLDLTSDVRAGEAEVLLSGNSESRNRRSDELRRNLDATDELIRTYQSRPQNAAEAHAFSSFRSRWTKFTPDLVRIVSMSKNGQQDAAVTLFYGQAGDTFKLAREELKQLFRLAEIQAAEARTNANESINEGRRWMADLILAALVLFFSISAYLWWYVSKPLLELGFLTHRLASCDTQFSTKFGDRRDAIGEMARALSVLRANTIELIESRKNISLQAEMERSIAAEQRNFVATTSHEFRTPLMAIDGQAQRLIATKDDASPTEIADRAGKMRAAALRMTKLVESLTQAVEITHGQLRMRTRKLNPEELLRDLIHHYREIGFSIALEGDIESLPAEIVGDSELLYLAFSNLLSNSTKYSEHGSPVRLEVSSTDRIIEVAVVDEGFGIPEDELSRVRQRYYRASNVGTIPGTGTGLYLVDEIVRQHHGRIEIESKEGNGTRVAISLPIEATE